MNNPSRNAPLTIDETWDRLAVRPMPWDRLEVTPPPEGMHLSITPNERKKSALVATVRDEGIILLEWIAHNRIIGFDRLFIYSNDNCDGSDDLLKALHTAGIIHLTWNIVGSDVKVQSKVYRHAVWYQPELWNYEWVAFLDADEFVFPVVFDKVSRVETYLDHVEREYGCGQINLNWRYFPGRLEFAREPGLLFERFQTSWWHQCVKSFSKLRLIDDFNAHYSFMKEGVTTINSDGESCIPNCSATPRALRPALGQVNHYWNRSFQEFYYRIRRGRPGSGGFHDWSTFYNFWGDSSEISPYPDAVHINQVKGEIDHLLTLPGVQDAVNKVEACFAASAGEAVVKQIYEETLRKRDVNRY